MIDTTFNSVEDYLNTISKFDIYATQLSARSFLCVQKEVQLPKLTVGNRFISSSLQYHSILKRDYLYISIPSEQTDVFVNGKKMHNNQSIVYTLNCEVLTRTPDLFDNYYIIIPISELLEYMSEEERNIFNALIKQPESFWQNFSSSTRTPIQLRSLIKLLIRNNEKLNYQSILDIQELFFELLYELLMSDHKTLQIKSSATHTRRLSIVKRSLNHIHKSETVNINSKALANISFCSLRSLEYAFRDILDITPRQYLIKRRLQLIHAELKKPGSVSINETLTKFGVVNLSHESTTIA